MGWNLHLFADGYLLNHCLPSALSYTERYSDAFVRLPRMDCVDIHCWPCPLAGPREVLQICRHFHTDVRKVNFPMPDFLATRLNRFHEADLVTWDEKNLSSVGRVSQEVLAIIEPTLRQIQRLKRPIPTLPAQIIHGDLTGNILFDNASSIQPGIIDMTIYWRPAEYAEAIIVADGLVWHEQGRELLELYGTDGVRLQLLVRALYWRCICFAIDPDMDFVLAHIPKVDFLGAAHIVEGALEGIRSLS